MDAFARGPAAERRQRVVGGPKRLRPGRKVGGACVPVSHHDLSCLNEVETIDRAKHAYAKGPVPSIACGCYIGLVGSHSLLSPLTISSIVRIHFHRLDHLPQPPVPAAFALVAAGSRAASLTMSARDFSALELSRVYARLRDSLDIGNGLKPDVRFADLSAGRRSHARRCGGGPPNARNGPKPPNVRDGWKAGMAYGLMRS